MILIFSMLLIFFFVCVYIERKFRKQNDILENILRNTLEIKKLEKYKDITTRERIRQLHLYKIVKNPLFCKVVEHINRNT